MEIFMLALVGSELALVIGMIIISIATTGKQRTLAHTINCASMSVIHFMLGLGCAETKVVFYLPSVMCLICAIIGAIKLRLENKTEEKASA